MFIGDMHSTKDYRTLPVLRTAVLIFLTLLDVQNVCCGITDDQIDKQFNTYSIIVPKLIHAKHKREIPSTKANLDDLEHVLGITLIFDDKGKEYIIDLSLNKELIPINYFEKHQKNGNHVINRPNANGLEFCYYNGKVRDSPGSWAAISTCDGIRGMFFDGNSNHYIENVECDSGNKCHVLYRHDDLNTNHTCGFHNTFSKIPNQIQHTKIRNTRSLHGPYNQNDKSRFIELVIVADNQEFKSFNSDLPKVHQHVKDIANIINSLFIPLNIFVVLVGVVVWNVADEIKISENGDDTLPDFLTYRREYLLKDYPNDNAQLLTKVQFQNGVVGKALKGPICTYRSSGGIITDHSTVRGLVASTIAHEMGHNLGMEHDSDGCECPDHKCIMANSTGAVGPTQWSSCSMEYLMLAFQHGMDYCLRNKPDRLFGYPVCGNNFVEGDEQCDCGVKDLCKNPCCNPDTCKFYENATCATGQCCDLNTCKIKPAGVNCRLAHLECDLPEYCDGDSEYCPDNAYKIDGSVCQNGQAFCYEGSCRTHTDQCKLLWGPTGESSSNLCYAMNNEGSKSGNCGYNRVDNKYTKCPIKDFRCGMLHCKHQNERLEFGIENLSEISHHFITDNKTLVPCRTAIVDLGLDAVDPGLAPDGAKCGEDMMCVKQNCVTISNFRAQTKTCLNDCNGNGVCNNKGNCHCNIGYAPPHCDKPGTGGSLDSGPASSPFNQGIVVGMYVFTLGAIPLLLAVLLFAYCSKNHRSPSDWNKSNRKKLSNDAEMGNKQNGGTVSPSSTLLINDHKQTVLQKELLGNYKGFSIKPLVPKEQQPAAASRTPIRPAPSVPRAAAPVVPNGNASRGERLQIGQPVLDATTSSAVRELVSVPLKPAPPLPSTATRPPATTAATVAAENNKNGGGYPTLRRITSFMKSQKPEEKRPAAVRVNAKFDRQVLKNLEISEPILQNEINVPSEPLPLEADRRKAVVLRAQSLRTANNAKHRPSVPNFGSMRSKRPTSAVTAAGAAAPAAATCFRPTSPPPQPPPQPLPPQQQQLQTFNQAQGYQVPPSHVVANVDDAATRHENIYSVIDENPIGGGGGGGGDDDDDDESCAYKVPRSLETSLLGEIVSAIQERNHESIYTSKPTPTDDRQQQTYENFRPAPSSPERETRPVDVKSLAATYGRPDLVQNCDENRSLNRSPDVLDAKKKVPAAAARPGEKPAVTFPKPVVGAAASRPAAATATVGLKKRLSDTRPPYRGVADVHKRYGGNGLRNPPVAAKPGVAGNR